MLRRVWWIMAVVAVAAIGAVVIAPRAPAPPSKAAMPAVDIATVRYGNYSVVLDESGYVGAPAGTTAELAFANPGILSKVYVSVGQHVERGQPLAALDTRAAALVAAQARAEAQAASAGYRGGTVPDAAVTAARSRVQAAQDRVTADRAAVDRAQRLYAAGVVALKDVQGVRATLAGDVAAATTAQSELRAAGSQTAVVAAQVRAASARADSADLALSQATLTAPASGFVTAIFHHSGEAVDPSKPIVAIGPLQSEVTLDVPGSDAAQIAVGNPVSLIIAGAPAASRGHVTAVVPAVNSATQTATVVVSGAPPNGVAGAAVRAKITVAHVRGLLIPESAIVADPQRGTNVVFVRQRKPNGTIVFALRAVTVAHEDGTTADVTGVRDGERIAAQGAFQLLAPSTQ